MTADRVPEILDIWARRGKAVRIQCGRCGRVLGRGQPTAMRLAPELVSLVDEPDRGFVGRSIAYLDVVTGDREAAPGWRVHEPPAIVPDPDPDHWPASTVYRFACRKCGATPSMQSGTLGRAFVHEWILHGQCDRLIVGDGTYAELNGGPVRSLPPDNGYVR